ncbi:MAG: acyl carrier protein [Peptococcaceae bacterium]|nr:acyl carrier protein [Peptococcaceae bacterium]
MMVLDDVKAIVANQMNTSPSLISETTTFYDLEADSLDVVEVIMALESKFDIILPDEAVETFKTVGDLAKYIADQLR